MTDEANAVASDATASETVQSDDAIQSTPEVDSKPAASAREAVERAFASVAEPPKTERARDEAGRFTKADDKPTPKADAGPVDPLKADAKPTEPLKAEPPKLTEAKPEPAKPVNVPPGLTKAAQEAWAQTPEAVRADVERRIGELTQGIEGYRQQLEPIRKYVDMAKQHGTTLDSALANYTAMEDMLTRDFVGGVRQLCQNMGVHPAQLVQALTGQQINGVSQPSMETQQLRQTNDALRQEIASLKEQFTGFKSSYEESRSAEMIERFASSHPHFDALRESMGHMLATGFAKDLSDAYEKAVRLNPDVFAKVEAEKAAKAAPQTPAIDPAQTRSKAALSVTGSPPVGSNPSTRKPAGSPREAIDNAFASVGL